MIVVGGGREEIEESKEIAVGVGEEEKGGGVCVLKFVINVWGASRLELEGR